MPYFEFNPVTGNYESDVNIVAPNIGTIRIACAATYNVGNYGNYSGTNIASNSQGYFNFHFPSNLLTLTSLNLIGIVTPAAALAGRDIDRYSHYGSVGQAYNTHSQSDLATTFDLSTQSNMIWQMDISSLFTSWAAGDCAGLQIDHNSIGGSIYYLGILLVGTV